MCVGWLVCTQVGLSSELIRRRMESPQGGAFSGVYKKSEKSQGGLSQELIRSEKA